MSEEASWRSAAERVAQSRGWKLIEQADGRLAFDDGNGHHEPILFTGNMQDITAAISRAADRLAVATSISKAVIDGRKAMSLAEKMARLAERSSAVPKALEARADALLPRLDALEAKGGPAFEGLEMVIADAEKGVASAEAAMRLLTNGGPLSGSGG